MEVTPGSVIGGRYRVQRRAWGSGSGAVWLAMDSVLEREVFIHAFPGVSHDAVSRAVASAAHLTHPGLCQIYDITSDPVGIVAEHAPGGRLADRKDGALPLAQAAAITMQLSAAIGALHEHGIAHGAVGPDTVLFDEEGRGKLASPAVVTSLGDDAPGVPEGYRPSEEAPADIRDRYALAAIAYRLFTGREPGPGAPPARSVRRSLPPEVDALLARGLGHDSAARPSPEEFRRILAPISSNEPQERGPGFIRQEARWLVPVLLLIGLGVAATIVGVGTGAIKIGGGGGGGGSPAPSATPTAFTVAAVEDFDPPPGNGEEHPEDAALTIDGKDTAWSTVGYSRAALDGRKKGVGLLFDLGRSRTVGRIEVRTAFAGWTAEWRVADSKGATADDYDVVRTFNAGDPVGLSPPRSGRYWLLWITRLANNGSGSNIPYQAQVSEVRFLAR